MHTICMGTVSLTDAEALLAELWIRLERDGEDAPELRFEFHGGSTVTIWSTCPEDVSNVRMIAAAV
jgi:hypothetical protein